MNERRITDDRDHSVVSCLFQPNCRADAGAHIKGGVRGLIGWESAHCVATDVAGHRDLELAQPAENRSVTAADAEHRRARHCLQRGGLASFQFQGLLQPAWRILPNHAKQLLASEVLYTKGLDELFNKWFPFFDHVNAAVLLAECPQHFSRQGVGHPEPEETCLRKDLARVLVGNPAGHHADPIGAFLDPVDSGSFRPIP